MGYFSGIYNPSDELTNAEQVAASRWELLRRNAGFQNVARQWIDSHDFRLTHVHSTEYHDQKTHYPRCALDWMITPAERVQVLKAQEAKKHIFNDRRFIFGPVRCEPLMSEFEIIKRRGERCLRIEPLRFYTLLTLDDNWRDAPPAFKVQFRFAVKRDYHFQELKRQFCELGDFLQWAAHRLEQKPSDKQFKEITQRLWDLGSCVSDIAEFHRIFALPDCIYTPAGLKENFQRIRASFEESGQFDKHARYNRRSSYLGTKEEWFWFLTAEHKQLDWRTSAGAYKLAELYSQRLKQKGVKRRSDARLHGHTGQSIPSKVLRDRRKTVQKHCRELQAWIEKSYPPVV